jgi:hypothetical protein
MYVDTLATKKASDLFFLCPRVDAVCAIFNVLLLYPAHHCLPYFTILTSGKGKVVPVLFNEAPRHEGV